jgi:hypothetical protein
MFTVRDVSIVAHIAEFIEQEMSNYADEILEKCEAIAEYMNILPWVELRCMSEAIEILTSISV